LTCVDKAEDVDGIPLGIQVVCRRLEDEKLLAITKYLYELLPGISALR
jgi:Asp-tRNA(Asn)/Glu-tRNA(Gln) amidotransferase A subunit family amidase